MYRSRIFFSFFILFAAISIGHSSGRLVINSDQYQKKIFAGSGQNQVLVPIPETFNNEDIEFNIISSNPELLEYLSVDYIAGQTFAVVNVGEKGHTGNASLTVNVKSSGQTHSVVVEISISPYQNPGTIFQIHDIIFWQEAIPLSGQPVFETIISSSEGPYSELNYDEIPLTVGIDCTSGPCTGHDFFTSLYKGYLVPPVSGTYHFYMRSENSHSFWLSPDADISNAKNLVSRSSEYGNIGTEIENRITKSAPVELEAGQVYAFYATQWIVHSTFGGIMWDGPGIERGYIPGENMMPIYDVEKPASPENLELIWRSASGLMLSWGNSTDNIRVVGYNLYLNGTKINGSPITETTYLIENLPGQKKYSIAVSALDPVGNESNISNILEAETHREDNTPPYPPQNFEIVQATGLAIHLRWTGATDSETEVIGYNIYVDNELYNTSEYIYSNEIVIHHLNPQTEYSFNIESVDAGFNVSEKSNTFSASTSGFDPLGPSLGEHTGKVVIHNKNTSWAEGIGLNGPYENGDMVNDPEIKKLVTGFYAGAIRWGAISANSKSFEQSTGAGKQNTYGKMLNLANEMGARFALTVGVQEDIDYLTEPATFLYLLEYLAGDASTTWGAVRAAEGFAEPLLQKGKGILLEFGNEVWGGASHDAQIGANYTNYAAWVRDMTEVIKSSPYYDPEKIILVYSGRYPQPDGASGRNTMVLTDDRGHADCLAVSGYLGGNLNYDPEIPQGESELDYYKNGVAATKANIDGMKSLMKEVVDLTGTFKTFYLYESNMTTTSYNGRFGQAIVLTDYLANSMNYGSIVPSIFHLTGGQWRITRPVENYRQLPLYTTGKFFNRFCKGHILETEFLSNDIITNANNINIGYAPVGAYTYNSGENFSLLMINRDFENDFTVQLDFPSELSIGENAMMYTIWSEDYSSFDANIDSSAISLTDELLVKIPRYSMAVITFTGSDPGYEQLPLGYFDRKRPESLSVTSTRNFIIDTNRGSDVISTEVLPDDAFSSSAILDIIENNTESIITRLAAGRLHIKASGKCGDEGEIKIHVYAADNHELFETVTVQVTNQGTDCPSTGTGILELANTTLFYPNPATERITFNKNLATETIVEIYDQQGKKILLRKLDKGYEIPVAFLKPGLYILKAITPDGKTATSKMQKN